MNAATEKHCGGCGIHLGSHVQQIEAELRIQFDEIAKLDAECRHSEAIDRLLALNIAEHSRLANYREQASQTVATLRAEIVRFEKQREAAIAQGRDLLAKFDYEQAAITLEQVPAPYRTDEHRELLGLVRTRQVDMLTLLADIRRSLAEKRTDCLLDKVEELLRLKPDHAHARTLADKLRPLEHKRRLTARDELYKAATACLAQHDYAGALQSLEQIHQAVLTPRLVKLIDEVKTNAAETAWLARDLREAVVYDEHLLPVAERLFKLQPNEQSKSFVQRLRTRAATNGSCPTAPNPWPTRPTSSFWGPPLETVTAFQRIDSSSLEDATFQEAPDRFCVAAGLALQGLEQNLLSINLAPREKSSLLRGLFRKKKATAWGIDVGRAALKAIRLFYREEDDRVVAEAAVCIEHARLLNAPDAEPESILRDTLDKLFERDDLKDAPLCVSIPGHKVLYRALALPLVDDKKLAELMTFEIRQLIPFPPDEVVWGYQMLGGPPTDAAFVSECEVALLALKLEEARAAIAPFTQRGLKVEVLTSDAAALFNFVMFESEAAPRPESQHSAATSIAEKADTTLDDVTVVLDVGTDSSNLIVFTSRAMIVRSIPLGGNSFSRAMVKEFQLTFAQAEKVKRTPTAVRELHRLYAVLEPRLADLIHETHRTIDTFLHSHPVRRVNRFIVLGGGLKMHGALRFFWHGE